jgi:hypothetical protein
MSAPYQLPEEMTCSGRSVELFLARPAEVYHRKASPGIFSWQILFQYKVVGVRKGTTSAIMGGSFSDESHYRQFRSPRRTALVRGFVLSIAVIWL